MFESIECGLDIEFANHVQNAPVPLTIRHIIEFINSTRSLLILLHVSHVITKQKVGFLST